MKPTTVGFGRRHFAMVCATVAAGTMSAGCGGGLSSSPRQYSRADVARCITRWTKHYNIPEPDLNSSDGVRGLTFNVSQSSVDGTIAPYYRGQTYTRTVTFFDEGLSNKIQSVHRESGRQGFFISGLVPYPWSHDLPRGPSQFSYYPGTDYGSNKKALLSASTLLIAHGPLPPLSAIVYGGANAQAAAQKEYQKHSSAAGKAALFAQLSAIKQSSVFPSDPNGVKETGGFGAYSVTKYETGNATPHVQADVKRIVTELGGPHVIRVGNVVYSSWRPIPARGLKLLKSGCRATGKTG